MKKNVFLLGALALALPNLAFAAEAADKTMLHLIYERTFGPIGAVAGVVAMVVFWQLAKKVEGEFRLALKLFVAVLLFINIGSIAFGIHGSGIISGELSRYIERACRLTALLLADVAALTLFVKINKKENKAPEIAQTK